MTPKEIISGNQHHSVILFDGQCNMCNKCIRFVSARDANDRFRFAPLQSPAAERLMSQFNCGPADTSSVLLIEQGSLYRQSTAALRITQQLRSPWWLLSALRVVPECLRNGVYQWIARRRYQWFGRSDVCQGTPMTAELRSKFL